MRGGAVHVILTDRAIGARARADPDDPRDRRGAHASGASQELRTFTSLNVRSGECLDVHYFAVLIGVGATTVNAYLAQETIADRHRRGLFGDMSLDDCLARYKKAIDEGLLKIMSKMGISVISSYRGGYNFEAVGLSRSLVGEYLPRHAVAHLRHRPAPASSRRCCELHARAWNDGRRSRCRSAASTATAAAARRTPARRKLIHMLQQAVATDSYGLYKKYAEAVDAHAADQPARPARLRAARARRCRSRRSRSITEIRKRFVTPGMSLGALGARGARDAERSP